MSSPKGLDFVRDNGLCIACGACSAVAPNVRVTLRQSRDFFEPTAESLGQEVHAAEVCPSLGFDFERDGRTLLPADPDAKFSTSLGQYRSIHFAQSTDPVRSFDSTSGAVIPELASLALQSGTVSQVISLVHTSGLDYEARGITSPADLNLMPKSVYHAVNFDTLYRELETFSAPSAVIALPCQLEGLAKVLAFRPELRRKVGLTVGLMCAWAYSRKSVEFLEAYSGRQLRPTTAVQHRGGGPFGRYRVSQSGTNIQSYNRRTDLRYLTAFSRDFNLPRCSICTNHLNYVADIVVGDSWIPETRFSNSGISLVITRSKRGEMLLQDARRAGKIRTAVARTVDVLDSEGSPLVHAPEAYAQQRKIFGSHVVIFPNVGVQTYATRNRRKGETKLRQFAIKNNIIFLYFVVKWSRDSFRFAKKVARYFWIQKLSRNPRQRTGLGLEREYFQGFD